MTMREPVPNLLDSLLNRQKASWLEGNRPSAEELLEGSSFGHDSEALLDQTHVAGWLDHSRRAANQQRWKHRIPPREYDELRDEALLLSLLLDPHQQEPVQAARQAIR